MFLPEIKRYAVQKYLEVETSMGTFDFANQCMDEIENENPELWKLMQIVVRVINDPVKSSIIVSYMLMEYKLLRIQAEADLLDRLFD